MNRIPTIAKTLPIAVIVAFFATRYVHGRFGDETFICAEMGRCELGSALSWFLTGITAAGPFIALGGFHWSRSLHTRERLGPFSQRFLPDGGQILEILSFVAALAATYWLTLNGPSIEPVDVEVPNSWAQWLREFRAPDVLDADARQKLDEVPSRRTWFAIGLLLGAPFTMSFGATLGREWYGRKRRKAQKLAAQADAEPTIDLTEMDKNLSGRATIDLTEVEQDVDES